MVGWGLNHGILQLASQEVFKAVGDSTDRAYEIKLSYIEIYNEVKESHKLEIEIPPLLRCPYLVLDPD